MFWSPGAAQSCVFGFPACHADAARQVTKQAEPHCGVCGSTNTLLDCPAYKHMLLAEGELAELASDTAMVQIWGQKGCQAQVFPGGHSKCCLHCN